MAWEESVAAGYPVERREETIAAYAALDVNDDGLICWKDLPDTPGHLGGWIFNGIDNTASVP